MHTNNKFNLKISHEIVNGLYKIIREHQGKAEG